MTTAQDGGKVVRLTHRPPLPTGNAPGTHFCYRPYSVDTRVKRRGREVTHSPPSCAEDKKEWSYTSTPPVWPRGTDSYEEVYWRQTFPDSTVFSSSVVEWPRNTSNGHSTLENDDHPVKERWAPIMQWQGAISQENGDVNWPVFCIAVSVSCGQQQQQLSAVAAARTRSA